MCTVAHRERSRIGAANIACLALLGMSVPVIIRAESTPLASGSQKQPVQPVDSAEFVENW